MRNGQWVKFKIDANTQMISPVNKPVPLVRMGVGEDTLKKIHMTDEGHYVGIFQKGGVSPLTRGTDNPRRIPDQIIPVSAELGENVRYLFGATAAVLGFAPSTLADLQPVVSRADIPDARLIGVSADWQPRP